MTNINDYGNEPDTGSFEQGALISESFGRTDTTDEVVRSENK